MVCWSSPLRLEIPDWFHILSLILFMLILGGEFFIQVFFISLENFFCFFFLVFDFILVKFAGVLDTGVHGYASIILPIIDKSKLDYLRATLFGT